MDKHQSVLLNEAIEMLDVKEDGIYVDGTLGRGGHSKKILEKLKNGKLYCFDLDEKAIEESKERLKDYSNVIYIHDNYMNMNKYVDCVDGILLDLGVSSPQFDEAIRGFSYRYDGPLDMRMNQDDDLTAYKIINEYSKEELLKIFFEFGEEKHAKRIVEQICLKRQERPIETTIQLVEVIKEALPQKVLRQKGHPAKQVFQALRIAVNHELDSLSCFLNSFDQLLAKDGRCVIISFHSLEDRMVKQRFKQLTTVDEDKSIFKLPEEIEKPEYELLNRKVIVPSEKEMELNPRSKSAKLRGLRRLNNG